MTTLEDRIAQLERTLSGLIADGDRSDELRRSVERLAKDMSELTTTLVHVDEQQQSLVQLRQDVNRVESNTATTQVVEDKERAAQRARRKIVISISAAFVVVAAILAYTINADYHACVDRQDQLSVQVALFQGVAGTSPEPFATQIRTGANKLAQTRVDCDDVYRVHW